MSTQDVKIINSPAEAVSVSLTKAPDFAIPVDVVNRKDHPVPVKAEQEGAWQVGISGVPKVQVEGTPSVQIAGTPTVALSASGNAVQAKQEGAWTVGLSGTPAVSIAGVPKVEVSNFTSPPSSVSAARQSWEYLVGTYASEQPTALQSKFNELGGQGWEWVGTDLAGHYYFKRPK